MSSVVDRSATFTDRMLDSKFVRLIARSQNLASTMETVSLEHRESQARQPA